MNDLISRQAAIDAVAEGLKRAFVEYRDAAEKMLNKVPSAQLIQCKECVYGNKMKNTIRCELMDYLPVECDHFCSWAERVIYE